MQLVRDDLSAGYAVGSRRRAHGDEWMVSLKIM